MYMSSKIKKSGFQPHSELWGFSPLIYNHLNIYIGVVVDSENGMTFYSLW